MRKMMMSLNDGYKIVDSLTVINMKYNYPDFVLEYGHTTANEKMANLYGASWTAHKEEVWFWFDNEFYRDDSGEVHV